MCQRQPKGSARLARNSAREGRYTRQQISESLDLPYAFVELLAEHPADDFGTGPEPGRGAE